MIIKLKNKKLKIDGRRRDAYYLKKLEKDNTLSLEEKERVLEYANLIYFNENALNRRNVCGWGKDEGGLYVLVEYKYLVYTPHPEVPYTRWNKYKEEREKIYLSDEELLDKKIEKFLEENPGIVIKTLIELKKIRKELED